MDDNELKLLELAGEATVCLIKCLLLLKDDCETKHGFIDIMKELLDNYDERKTL